VTTIERYYKEASQPDSPLRVTMLGIRGFPNVQGGAENHAQNLSVNLSKLGCDVEVIVRSPHIPKGSSRTFGSVKLVRVWSPRMKGVEAVVHTFLGVLRAAWTRPDILHIHSVGPALFTPLARALGLRVVVTHHLLNYENEKWGVGARAILRLGERAGMMLANGRIAVSATLAARMERTYRVPVRVIPNGISRPQKMRSTAILAAFDLTRNRYALTVARVDEQKRQLDLIKAFARARRHPWKLAVAGCADYSSEYARAVAQAARETAGVVLLGHQTGEALAELYTHAGVFVLPSSHEGQPIAVLEAMSYGCPTILSDIPPHREIGASNSEFVRVGDITALAERLSATFCARTERRLDGAEREGLMKNHDWRQIARHTLQVYIAAVSEGRGVSHLPGAVTQPSKAVFRIGTESTPLHRRNEKIEAAGD
jgi:glycosyltransferase involved in cell wall biosynthesis